MIDIGFKGILLFAVIATKLIFILSGAKNKWRDRVSIMQTNLAQAYIIDFFGLSVRCLNFSGKAKMDTFLKGFSFIVSLAFLSVFTYEFIQEYLMVERLVKMEKA